MDRGQIPCHSARHWPECLLILNPTKVPCGWVCSLCLQPQASYPRIEGTRWALLVLIPRRMCLRSGRPRARPFPQLSASFSPSKDLREPTSIVGSWPGRLVWVLVVLMASFPEVPLLVFQAVECSLHPNIMVHEVAVGLWKPKHMSSGHVCVIG